MPESLPAHTNKELTISYKFLNSGTTQSAIFLANAPSCRRTTSPVMHATSNSLRPTISVTGDAIANSLYNESRSECGSLSRGDS